MKKNRSKVLSAILAAMLTLALVPVPAFADITSQEEGAASAEVALESATTADGDISADADSIVDDSGAAEASDPAAAGESGAAPSSEEVASAEAVSETEDVELGIQSVRTVIDYVYIEEANQIAGTPENIAVGFLDTALVVDSATLVYTDGVGQEHEVEMNAVVEGAVTFVVDEGVGTYYLESLRYTVGEDEFEVAFSDEGIDASFNVSEPAEEGDVATTAYIVEDDGSLTQAASLEDAVEEVSIDAAGVAADDTELAIMSEEDGELEPQASVRVALDPGHDGSHQGAHYSNLKEEELTLKIALYCKAELLTYPGVEVYMTHDTLACPYPGMRSQDCNRARVRAATAWGADVYVSFHLNSYSTSTHGYEVYYSSSSPQASSSRELAGYVSTQLAGLGIPAHGNAIKDNEWIACQYSGDYGNIPGILIEHSFIDGDYSYLSNEGNLKALGVADATAIANYFHVAKRSVVYDSTVGNIEWLGEPAFRVYITGSISQAATVRIPVWTDANGQDDLVWYTATRDSSGNYYVDVKLSDHKNEVGPYNIHCYVQDGSGAALESRKEGYTTYTYSTDEPASVGALLNADQTVAMLQMVPGDASYDATRVRFAVWSNQNGQDDLVWYDGTRDSNGIFSYNVQASAHDKGKPGKYNVHCYAIVGSTPYFIGATTYEIVEPGATIEVTDVDTDAGTYTVTVYDIVGFSGISKVMLPTWVNADQSDIKWYTANSNGDGTYSFTVPMSDHSWIEGTYKTHCYIVASTGKSIFVGNVSQPMTVPESSVEAELSTDEKNAQITVVVPYDATSVSVPVWSVNNGQDDLVWYKATKQSDGSWTVTVPISKHHDAGVYNVHAYATYAGSQRLVDATKFEISAPTADVTVSAVNSDKGTYTVTVSGIDSASGVTKVQMPTWIQPNQSDIKWYNATKNSDGTYSFEVPISDHAWAEGTYHTHCYLTTGNGVVARVGTVDQDMSIPATSVTAELNSSETTAAVTVVCPQATSVTVPVWSAVNGQDDLKWYTATKQSDGTWQVNVPISSHRSTGKYNAHCYATINGSQTFIGAANFEVKPVEATVEVTGVNTETGTYTVTVSDIVCPAGVTRVQLPTWVADDQSDIRWHTAVANGDGTYSLEIPMSDHKWHAGTYKTHCYITDANGIQTRVGTLTQDMALPEASITASLDIKESTATIEAIVPYDATAVSFPTWSENKGQNDIVWYRATKQADGRWVAKVPISKHKDAGVYDVHCYATINGTQMRVGTTNFTVTAPTGYLNTSDVDEDAGAFRIWYFPTDTVSPIAKVQFAVWSTDNQSDIHWYTATKNADGSWRAMARAELHNYNSGTYKIHCYVTLENGVVALPASMTQKFVLSSDFFNNVAITGDYSIMGASLVDQSALVAYYNAATARRGYSFPSYYASHYSTSGVNNIEDFCRILYEEAEAEGVRAEVVFCQCMYETNWLQYTGDVSIGKYNFAGLGAIDSDPVNYAYVYSSVRMGLRAQVQHLKAYASPQSLNNPLVPASNAYSSNIVDGSRYAVVGSAYGFGCAPTVRGLSSKWASGSSYGDAILKYIYELRTY